MSPRVKEILLQMQELLTELQGELAVPPGGGAPGPHPDDSGQDPPPHPHD